MLILFLLLNLYLFLTFTVFKVISLYVYHPDIESGNKVPSDGFSMLLKLICPKMNLFFLLT